MKMTRSSTTFRRALVGLVMSGAMGGLAGCTVSGHPGSGGGGTGAPSYVYLTGNWQIDMTNTTAPVPFTALSGFINEQGDNPGTDDLTTAALQAKPGDCYVSAVTIPLQGSTQGDHLGLHSFSVNGQFVTISATKDSTATHFTGTYTVSGGCANGAAGTLSGTKYAPLTGTYTGPITGSSPAKTIQLALTQYTTGTGDGVFLISGTAAFTGFTCFTQGTMPSTAGWVSGSSASLTFNTNDASGAQVVLTGTFDSTAHTLTLSSVQITGGSCSGSVGGATLTLQ